MKVYILISNLFNIKLLTKSFTFFVLILIFFSCYEKKSDSFSSAFKSYFIQNLRSADSSIVVKSFEFIDIDTLYEKWALNRQKFPYLHGLNSINNKLNALLETKSATLASKENSTRQMNQLLEEKNNLSKALDSLNLKLATADSIHPIGYIARFQYSIIIQNGIQRTDTIGYALDQNMSMIDWDDNNKKSIDSIVSGNRPVLR